jgi:hypothetical protein
MGCNCSSEVKKIKDWEPLKDYIQGGKSIWLSESETIEVLKLHNFSTNHTRYQFNPFEGTMKIEMKEISEGYFIMITR